MPNPDTLKRIPLKEIKQFVGKNTVPGAQEAGKQGEVLFLGFPQVTSLQTGSEGRSLAKDTVLCSIGNVCSGKNCMVPKNPSTPPGQERAISAPVKRRDGASVEISLLDKLKVISLPTNTRDISSNRDPSERNGGKTACADTCLTCAGKPGCKS